MQPKLSLFRSPALVCATVLLAACAQPAAPKDELGVRREAVVANGGFEADAIGVSPSSWTIEKYLNNKVTPLAPGNTNNLGLLAVPPTSVAQLNLTANAGGLNTLTVGAAVVESQPDPDLGAAGSLRFPKFGTRSVVVNPGGLNQGPSDALPTGRNQSVNSMKQTMTLAAGDVDPFDGALHIRFVAAPVLQDPGHTNYEQPYFYIQVRNVTRDTTLYSNFNFAGQAGVAWKTNAANTIKYTDWQLIDVAPGLNAAIGEQIELIVFAAGCSRNGHWGRVYVDAFGATIPGLYVSGTAPASSPSNADLTYTLNYRNGSAVPAVGTTVTFNTPPNTTFVSSAGATCTNPGVGNAGAVTCTIGALAAGAGGTFTVTVRIAAGVTGLLTAQNYFVQATGVNPLIGSKIDTIVYSGPATLSVVSGTPQSATVNTAFGADLVVVARDSANQPIAGLTVNYAGPGSGASATFPLSFAVTGANGQAALRPTANTTAGSYSVGAAVAGIAQTASFALTNTAGAPASISVVSGTPQSRTVGQAFADPLVVVVRDAFGNPVPGATVTVGAPGSGASATTTAPATTNASGQTQVTATANTTAGTYNVTLSVAGVATAATFALTNTAGAAASVTVVSGTPQSRTVGQAFAAPLVVVVRDAFGNPVQGATVTFTPPASGASAALSSPATTDAAGQTQVTATANTTAGAYAVSASIGVGTAAGFALTNTAGAPASITVVSGTPQSRTVGQAFTAPLVVVVRDAFGNPVPGATVTVGAPGSGASATTTAPATTNASGQTQVTATANTTAGTYNVTLSVAGVATAATFALTNTAGAAASVTVVSGTPQSRTVGTAFAAPLVVVVRDAFGNPVQGATVTFTPPGSGASAALSSPATTDAAGQTQVTATANTTAGAYAVSASIGVGTAAGFALTNTAGAPASVSVTSGGTAQSTVVLTPFAQPLAVVVRDSNGNPVSGVALTYAGPATGASATFTGTSTTNAQGQVSLTASANAVAGGPYTVTATAAGLAPVSFTLTNTPGAPAAIAVVSGTPQSATVGTAFAAPLVVVVTDAQGNVVPGATVTFTPPASGASAGIAGTFTTDAQGRVSVTATANGTEGGPYTVAATVTGVSAPANFALTNGPAAPQAPTITTPTEGAVLTDSTPDVSGTAAPNALVTLYADGGATPVCTATANASGAWTCTVAPALADGPHTFVATTANSAGATASSAPRTVSLDATAPATPVITAPTEGATTSASPTISGNAEPGASVRIYLDGSATPACTATADAAGSFSCVILGPLAPGAHAVTADATDAAGNASAKTAARNFTVAAATPPGPPVITGPARDTFTADTTPTVSGTATPGAEVRVFVDGSSTPACTTTASATGAWSCDVSPALADGPHVLVATATTPGGTSPPSLATPFTVDTAAPAAPVITAPAANATTSDRPVYAGTAEPGSTVSVFVDGSTTAACTTTANAAGAWSCAGATPLSTGPHGVTASTRDAAGNSGPLTASTPFTVGAGVVPEVPVITAPAAGSSTSDTTPTFSGTAAPLSSVVVKVDGTTVCTTTADANGRFSCAPAAPLGEGPHQVTATASNGNGTSPASASVPFTVDTAAPGAPVITAPTAGQQTGTTPTLSGTAEAGSTVVVRVDGQPVCEVVADSAGKFSCVVSRPLAPGPHEATASATDAAGNRSATAAPTPFTVAAAPSVPVLQQPAAGSTTSTRTPTFGGLAEPGASVEVSVDGTVVCTTTADAMGRFSCTPTAPLADGPHSATVKATTPGGTASSAPSAFTVAIVPVITSPAEGSSGTDTTPTFSGTAEPGSTVTVKVDGMGVCTTTADAQGRFSCDAAAPLAPGPHSATATATTGGTTSAPSAPVGFTVQGDGPVLVAPTEGSTTGEFPTFSGTAKPNATVSILVDGAVVCTTTADAQGSYSCTGQSALPKGEHTVVVRDDGTSLSSTPTRITVVARSLVGGGCAATGGTPLVWLAALALLALASHRRRGAALAVVRARSSRRSAPSHLRAGLGLALAIAALSASPARAQANAVPAFELERVRLAGGAQHGLLVESADLLPKFGYRVALTFHYEKDPLVAREDGKRVGAVVGSRIGVHLSGAFSFTDWLDVSLQVPLVLSQAGEELSAKGYAPVYGGVVAGTPWVGVRGGILQERRGNAIDLSLGVALGIPLASAAALTKDDSVSVIPSIGIGRTLTSWLRVGGSVGFLVRNAQILTPSSSVNDQVGSLVTPGIILSTLGEGLRGELSARFDVPLTRAPFGAEVDVGLRYPLFGWLEVYAVGGPGFGTLPGTPSVRILAGLALAPAAKRKPVCVEGQPYVLSDCPELDLDGDGTPNGRDACAAVPGIAARQGCPDVDSDGDGVLDAADACPNTKGLKENKGCPEPDADGDGVADAADACPNLAGPAALKGCPDSDGDGITDPLDACPKVKGLAELKGCPDPDSDGDGVVDRVDACLTKKGPAENAGCPAAKEQLVVISKERLIIKDKVNFATGKSVVLPKSFTLLEQVARILKEHPEVERVSIEGHTDSRGNRAQNVKLSQARAEAVRQWLLKAGIAASRMSSKGFGPDRPLQTNDTDAGREANRRVDFVIVGAETTKAP